MRSDSVDARIFAKDEETGLYYYGARCLDPKYSRLMSGDPALGEYVPKALVNDEAKKHNQNLPGQGGVFNTVNLHVYHYAGNNPVKYVDPDGRSLLSGLKKIVSGTAKTIVGGAGASFVLVADNGTLILVFDDAALLFTVPFTAASSALMLDGEREAFVGLLETTQAILEDAKGFGTWVGGKAKSAWDNIILSKSDNKTKTPKSGSGKEKADDVPSWAKGRRPLKTQNGKDFAEQLMNERYGKGNWKLPNKEYNKLKKWGDRGFE